jgi:hypothetical protein
MKSCMVVIWKTKCIIVNAIYRFYDDNIVFQLVEIFNLFGLQYLDLDVFFQLFNHVQMVWRNSHLKKKLLFTTCLMQLHMSYATKKCHM